MECKIKTKIDGSVEHHKACLFLKCFTQEYCTDYEETFDLVARLIFIRSLLAIAALHKRFLF